MAITFAIQPLALSNMEKDCRIDLPGYWITAKSLEKILLRSQERLARDDIPVVVIFHKRCKIMVDAAARLIRDRWRPEPKPAWVTCVPSKRHQALVPDFARRLAGRLGLPFVDCVRKVKDTEPQKTRVNSFQQTQNLLGTFDVDRATVRSEPVLLVDDMVDSRWTFTVLTALLRTAGSGPVSPFALADSSSEDGE